jgi:transcriptional regulator with XRE-family HTH domain
MDRVEAGRAIEVARKRMGLTKEQFAVRAGMTRVTLSRVESGEEVQSRTLRAALEAAGLDPGPSHHLADVPYDELVRELKRRGGSSPNPSDETAQRWGANDPIIAEIRNGSTADLEDPADCDQ